MGWFDGSPEKQWWDPGDWFQSADEVKKEYEIDQKKKVEQGKPTDKFYDQVAAQRESRKSGTVGGDGTTRYFPQDLYSESQPNGIHFYINARRNSAAAQAALSGPNKDKMDAAQAAYQEEYTKENRAKAEVLNDENELIEFATEKCDAEYIYMFAYGSWYVYDVYNGSAYGELNQFKELEEELYVPIR